MGSLEETVTQLKTVSVSLKDCDKEYSVIAVRLNDIQSVRSLLLMLLHWCCVAMSLQAASSGDRGQEQLPLYAEMNSDFSEVAITETNYYE